MEGAIRALELYRDEINALNVFPVPDGDTGTNMLLTMQAVWQEMAAVGELKMEYLCDALSMGSLMGARGNSGVVLSQILKGFTEVLRQHDDVGIAELAAALDRGATTAYKAVMRPVEGTILTVIREAALEGQAHAGKAVSVEAWLRLVIEEALRSLANTPELLPVLKEAGVVDAGGRGLVAVLEGMLAALTDTELREAVAVAAPALVSEQVEDLKYEAQFMLSCKDSRVDQLRDRLNELGGSLLVVGSDRLYRVHIHTNDLGKVIGEASGVGTLSDVEITDLFEQVEELAGGAPSTPVEQKPIGVVAVAAGEGVKQVLTELGVDRVVEGGQSMNPSTAEILAAVDSIPQRKILVMPNNKNIIPAAEQAIRLTEKDLAVVPTRSIPECLSALVAFDPDGEMDQNRAQMAEAIEGVRSGAVTKAVRDSKYKGGKIKEGDFIGLFKGSIVTAGTQLAEVTLKLVERMAEKGADVVTLIRGEAVADTAGSEIENRLREIYGGDLEVLIGNQPLYHYLVGIE
ncbi:MAG: DAK2 domain-containing protein [Candidatus Geothermincolia bacterium]